MRTSIAVALRCILATTPWLASVSVAAGQQLLATRPSATEIISPDRIRAHMTALSSDDMEGRETGTRGFDGAAQYVASELQRLGLTPLSPGYRQHFSLRRARVDETRSSLSIEIDGAKRPLVYGEDFVTYGSTSAADVTIVGECVFVGDGVTAPEHGIDAYRGLDVRSKVVIALPGAPASLTPSEKSFFDDLKHKTGNAASHGAAAFIVVDDVPWDLRVRAAHQLGATSWLPRSAPDSVKAVLYMKKATAEELFGSGIVAGSGKIGAALGVARLRVRNGLRTMRSANVLAALTGADPVLSREYVVVTAHLDHVGIGTPVNGDAIYNGAIDNASGVGALLTIARALSALPTRPARSVLFVATTGEEQGEVGSDYFVHHPPVPLDRIVASLNIDGISFVAFHDVDVGGGADSSLGARADEAATRLGLRANKTSLGLGGSDHSPFLEIGIPALWIGAALSDGWMNTRYHTPQDDMTQPLDFAPAQRYTRFVYEVVYSIAQARERPRWSRNVVWGRVRNQ